jgi:hypothetical protein
MLAVDDMDGGAIQYARVDVLAAESATCAAATIRAADATRSGMPAHRNRRRNRLWLYAI